jgi:hypothetical protein
VPVSAKAAAAIAGPEEQLEPVAATSDEVEAFVAQFAKLSESVQAAVLERILPRNAA